MSKDNWIKWNGGECPVDGDVMVEVMNADNNQFKDLANNIDWQIFNCNGDIVCYRILSEEKPSLIDQVAKAQSEIAKLKEQAQKANEALVKANDELSQLVKRLEQEITDKTGLSCVIGSDESVKVDAKVTESKMKELVGIPDGVDVDDPRTWNTGDVVEFVGLGDYANVLTNGKEYIFDKYNHFGDYKGYIDIKKDNNDRYNGFHKDYAKFRFVRRP